MGRRDTLTAGESLITSAMHNTPDEDAIALSSTHVQAYRWRHGLCDDESLIQNADRRDVSVGEAGRSTTEVIAIDTRVLQPAPATQTKSSPDRRAQHHGSRHGSHHGSHCDKLPHETPHVTPHDVKRSWRRSLSRRTTEHLRSERITRNCLNPPFADVMSRSIHFGVAR
jgi:hypothetical protein